MNDLVGKIEGFSDFLPKKQPVMVGESEMVVKELVASKRDAIVKVLLTNLEIMPLLQPFMEAVRNSKGDEEGITVDLSELADKAKDVLMKLLSKDLTLVDCIILDVEENRSNVGIPMAELKTDSENGYKYCEEMFEWVKDNITPRQEFAVVDAFLKVNDFVGLVKNYFSLIGSTINSVRVTETEDSQTN